jgi:hypothetical protein
MLGSTTYCNHRLKQQETKTGSVSVTDEKLLPERKLFFLAFLTLLSAAHCGNGMWAVHDGHCCIFDSAQNCVELRILLCSRGQLTGSVFPA